jgi:hypothetical protein
VCSIRPGSGLRFLVPGICGAIALALLGSCAAMDPSVVLEGTSIGRTALPLDGAYDVTARAPFSGALTARVTARPTPDGFVASTRPGAAWGFVPGLARLLGPLFVPTLFPNGVILTWSSGLPTPDAPGEGWIGVAGVRSLGLRTRIHSIDEPIEMLNREGRRVGVIELAPRAPGAPAATDYRSLAASIAEATRTNLYDPELARSPSVRAYVRQLESVGARARDDVEFVFGAVMAARDTLRINTPIMWRRVRESASSPFAGWTERERSTIHVEFDDSTRIATVRVDAFLDAAEVDGAMRRVMDRFPRGLIVDLRACPGVTLASLRVAAWLTECTAEGPTLFSGRARGPGGVPAGPVSDVELRTVEEYDGMDGTLARLGCARVHVEPAGQCFSGPVALLIGRRTSASAEVLASVLQHSGRARLFGEPTAGRPIVSTPVDVGQRWVLWIAAWDSVRRGADAQAPPRRSIAPDVPGRDSKQSAIKWLCEGI